MNGIIGGIKANIGAILKGAALVGAAVGLGIGMRAALKKGDTLEMVEFDEVVEDEIEGSDSEQ